MSEGYPSHGNEMSAVTWAVKEIADLTEIEREADFYREEVARKVKEVLGYFDASNGLSESEAIYRATLDLRELL